MYADHAQEASIWQCLSLQFFPSSTLCTAWGAAKKCRLARFTARILWDLTRSTSSVLLFPSQRLCHVLSERLFRHSGELAAGWTSCSSSDSQLQVTGCMHIALMKRTALSVSDGYVSGCLTESARCHAQMPHEYPVTRQGDEPHWWALRCKHPSLTWTWSFLSMKALLCWISHISSTILNFSALTQKQNSLPGPMLSTECTHPSLLSFSCFCFPVNLCYHKKGWDVCMTLQSWKIQWHFVIPEGILSNLQMLKKNNKQCHFPKSVDISVQVVTHTLKI